MNLMSGLIDNEIASNIKLNSDSKMAGSNIVVFDPYSGMGIHSWLIYFDILRSKENKKRKRKLEHISKYQS